MAVQEGYLKYNVDLWAMGFAGSPTSLIPATDASKIVLDPEKHTYRFFGWYEKIINRLIEHHEKGQIVLGDMTRSIARTYGQSAELARLDQSGMFGPTHQAHARRMIARGGAGAPPTAGMVRTRVIKKPSLYVGVFGVQELYEGTCLAKVERPLIGGDFIRMKASLGHSAGTVASSVWHLVSSHHGSASQAHAIGKAAYKFGKKELSYGKKAYRLHKKIKSASVDTDDGFHLLKKKVRHVSEEETSSWFPQKTKNWFKKTLGIGQQKMCVKLSLLPDTGMLQIPVDGPWPQQAIANFVAAMQTPSIFEKVQKHLTPRV